MIKRTLSLLICLLGCSLLLVFVNQALGFSLNPQGEAEAIFQKNGITVEAIKDVGVVYDQDKVIVRATVTGLSTPSTYDEGVMVPINAKVDGLCAMDEVNWAKSCWDLKNYSGPVAMFFKR
jgi:hypothetical protein